MEFRIASLDDLDNIATIFLKCWTISYSEVLSDSARKSFTLESAKDLWRTSIEIPEDKETLLLLNEDVIAAVFRIGSDKSDHNRGHLFSLYVDPAHAGKGLGKASLMEAMDRIRLRGFHEMTLWVFAENTIAHSLYTKAGFIASGKTRTTPEWGAHEIELIITL